jgi:hypothetical protein
LSFALVNEQGHLGWQGASAKPGGCKATPSFGTGELRMIRRVWSVLCNQVFEDVQTGRAALSVLEAVRVTSDQGTPSGSASSVGGSFELVTLWYSDVGSTAFSYGVKASGPSGTVLASTDVSAPAFAPHALGVRTRVAFPGVTNDGHGVYWFSVMRLVDGQEILDAEVPLAVSLELA